MEIAILFLPLLASIISGFFGKLIGDRSSEIITSLFVVISASLSLFIFYNVISNQYESNIVLATWINSGSLNVNWSIKIDALSSVMLVVVTLVSALVHIYSIGYMSHDPHKPRFMAFLSLFTFAMLTLVTSDNFLQLFFGWEGVGLCSYFLIGFWFKRETANAAAIKAFVVNRVGDFGFALGIFLIFYLFGTINYEEVFNQIPQIIEKKLLFLGMNVGAIYLICILLFIGAMGKSAQIFLHTWLPDAHVQAPTAGSVVLAAILLKMGGYGFLRFSLPMFPVASDLLAPLVFWMSAIAIVYTSLVALAQQDMKKLIAYSSVAHMGYVTMGIFAANQQGIDGAIFQMLSHGFISGALFLCVGVIYDRMHTRDIDAYGGLVNRMPSYALIFMFFTMANVGLPGTSGFVGEFLTLMGIFQVNTWVALFAASGVILSAAYALWLYRRVVLGDLIKESLKSITDMAPREKMIFAPLVAMTLILGVYPALILDIIGPSVAALVETYHSNVAAHGIVSSAASTASH